MAVSKRTRFEVLRRDDYRCRYCRSTDNPLTIDHVIPVALGGSDDPSNLVACCKDCNAGKSSSSPNAAIVAQVAEDALRWAAAMKLAGDHAAQALAEESVTLTHFKDHVWGSWTTQSGKTEPLPGDWESAILRQLRSGLTMDDLTAAVSVAMKAPYATDTFRYFMGVCKAKLADRVEAARKLLADGSLDG